MTIFNKAMLASATVAVAAIATPASATSFAGNGAAFITDGTGAFFDTAIGAGVFEDVIDFTTSSEGVLYTGVLYFESALNITDLSATLNGEALTFTSSGSGFTTGTISLPVASGAQQIVITGLSSGNGAYSGMVDFSAVPETATWLMMMFGVGMAGAALRRRGTAYNVDSQSVKFAGF